MIQVMPAIDIMGGKAVRLKQGAADRQTVYSDSPADVAKRWDSCGVKFIHVVDLDGAFSGTLKNLNIIRQIKSAVNAHIELGGGIRNETMANEAFEAGVDRIVIGSRALDDKFLSGMIDSFGNQKVLVGIDARDGMVRVHGWASDAGVKATDLAKKAEALGVRAIIYTDIAKDGMLSGPNINGIKGIIKATSAINIIASGGISSLDDLRRLMALKSGRLTGVIIGKALYEDKIDLKEAIKICSQSV